MPIVSSFNEYQPITWFRRVPIYVTTIFCALFVLGMFVTTVVESAGVNAAQIAAFWMPTFTRGYLWQLLTYPFVAYPNFFFLFGVLFFYFAGVEVEKYLGRRRFLKLLAMLLLLPPVLVSGQSLLGLGSNAYSGSYDFTAALFVAFATLYPNLEYFGWVPLKWIAFACLFLSALSHLPRHDWLGLAILLAMCGMSFGYIRLLQGGGSDSEFGEKIGRWFRRRPKFRVVKSGSGGGRSGSAGAAPSRKRTTPARETDDVIESIDPLLDKIARHGIASLTTREREKLEKARAELLKKPSSLR